MRITIATFFKLKLLLLVLGFISFGSCSSDAKENDIEIIDESEEEEEEVDEDDNTDDDNTDDDTNGEFGLDPNLEPWENFDLSDWNIDTPAFDTDGFSLRHGEMNWDPLATSDSRPFFFTHTDGGMRFVSTVGGAKQVRTHGILDQSFEKCSALVIQIFLPKEQMVTIGLLGINQEVQHMADEMEF